MNYMLRELSFLSDFLVIEYRVCFVILCFLALINLLSIKRNEILFVLIVAIILGISSYVASDASLFLPFILILSARKITLDDFMKNDLRMKIPLLILMPILFMFGLTEVNNHFRNGVIRYSMGFYNPNVFSALIMSVVMEILYLRRNKISWREIIFAITSAVIIDYFAGSRTQVICIFVMLGFLLFFHYKRNNKPFKNKMLKTLLFSSALLMAILSFALTSLYINNRSETITTIDNVSTGRIKSSAFVVENQGISIMGNNQTLKWLSDYEDYNALDNVYIFIATVDGIIPLVTICTAMSFYLKNANQHRKKILVMIMVVFIVSGLMEKMCIKVQLNPFLLYFAYMIYGNPEIIPKKLKSENIEE